MSGAPAIEIIHEPTAAEPFVVLSKPAGLASAPLKSLDEDSAFSQCARLFPAVLNVRGKKLVEGGLLHRIDTATSGLLLAAASQEFYESVIAAQETGHFVKGYRALCQIDPGNAKKLGGFPPAPRLFLGGQTLSTFFRPYGKGGCQVRPVLPDSSSAALKKTGSKKLYSTTIVSVKAAADGNAVLVECKIAQGFRHQVRAHLAWIGLPIVGDALYNAEGGQSAAAFGGGMRFEAVSLEFPGLDSDKVFHYGQKD